ncbi:MAG: hypothetical protein UY50_C0027G0031 [Parcubacteria group bacterium GW2011_GWA2_49_9]|nr:MAG: hypothetical protein UY50_C0027G0031 [Parcubacteria group bacterium GW2011_GWA2_49_9]
MRITNMKTIINIKADRDIKVKAQKVAKQLGVPLSLVINNYLRDFIRDKEVHFSLNRDTLPLGKPEGVLKPAVKRRLERIHREVVARKGVSPTFENMEDAIRYLHSYADRV